MTKNDGVPDAWDDDWEKQVDQLSRAETAPTPEAPVRRAELLARHAENQRKLWESAEAPEENHYVAASGSVPLQTGFRPALKVLSRKPVPQMLARRDPVTGLEQLTLQDDGENDDEAAGKSKPSPEEIRIRQQRELEEKQRRYEEVRAKIFGGESGSPSGPPSPRNGTPSPGLDGRQSQRKQPRGRGGGYRGDGRQDGRQEPQPRGAPGGGQGGARELYDPNFSPKPGFRMQKRDNANESPNLGSPRLGGPSTPREEEQAIRAPYGPDSSGRGGFKFARRSNKAG